MAADRPRGPHLTPVPAVRSLLFIPGNRITWVSRADTSGADAIVVDLEDAVPRHDKDAARNALANLLEQPERPATPLFVRVNPIDDPLFLRDVEALAGRGIAGVMLPKVESANDILVADRVLSWFENPRRPRLSIIPVLETARAMRDAYEIASASSRVAYMGGLSSRGGDVERALGYRWSAAGNESLAMRSRVLLDARAAGAVNPLSGLWSDVRDLDGLRAFAEQSRELGYEGLIVIHPSHVPTVNATFTPSRADLDRDEALVHALDSAARQGRGAVNFAGHMVDEAMAATSRARLDRCRPGWEAEAPMLGVPAEDVRRRSQVGRLVSWLAKNRDIELSDWCSLWQWSISDLDAFWSAMWEFQGVTSHAPYDRVLDSRQMPGATWFPGALLNYAEHSLGTEEDVDQVAVVAHSQTREEITLTFGELAEQVSRARVVLQRLGVGRGDVVAGYLPNIPETLVAFLATASLGAVWSSCAPEYGADSVIERFAQLEPTVLLAVPGYQYGSRFVDRREEVAQVRAGLPTLTHLVSVSYGTDKLADVSAWSALLGAVGAQVPPLEFEPVPFDHPLYVLFSSGTTGKPKAIIHGHGGMLLEHFKSATVSYDLGPGDRMLWFTTTSWMMWNVLVGALLTRASIVMIDGDPAFPDVREQWRLAERLRPTLMGVSPGFLQASKRDGVEPAREFDLSCVRQLAVAGSPLSAENHRWIHAQLGDDVLVNPASGGTDVCTGLVQGSPWQPERAGAMSGACLGVDVVALDENGEEVVGELGELVVRQPMPSMPTGFWGDDGSRYRAAYFDHFPGMWRHGDWIRFAPDGTCVITGRSDATLNRGGVRLGTAEFYRVLEDVDGVADSLVVHLEDDIGGPGELVLFVVPRPGVDLDPPFESAIRQELRTRLSPRHVPDLIHAVNAVPYTRTGKKMEVPVKRIIQGQQPDKVVQSDSLANPDALREYVALARTP